MPDWVSLDHVAAAVNGRARAVVTDARDGDVVTLTFPISEKQVRTTIGGSDYTLTMRGNDVLEIDPPGVVAPLYQRAASRTRDVRWVSRERFVGDRRVTW